MLWEVQVLLDLHDVEIRVRFTTPQHTHLRLTLEYANEIGIRRRVLHAIAGLIQPEDAESEKGSELEPASEDEGSE